jgi:outer membrane lipoprotein carrier protein
MVVVRMARNLSFRSRFPQRLRQAASLVASVFLASSAFSPGYAREDLASAIAGLQRRYAAVNTMRADFRQTYRAPGVDQTESGTMTMKKPGLMRWEYREPEIKLFVADGRDTYLYTPADRQVLVQRFTAADLRSTPLQFLLGQGDIEGSYLVSWELDLKPLAVGTLLLRLSPRSGEPGYTHVTIECDGASFDMRRIVIHERSGNTSEFIFSSLRTNVKVDDRQFQFKIPKGVEVVRLDEK